MSKLKLNWKTSLKKFLLEIREAERRFFQENDWRDRAIYSSFLTQNPISCSNYFAKLKEIKVRDGREKLKRKIFFFPFIFRKKRVGVRRERRRRKQKSFSLQYLDLGLDYYKRLCENSDENYNCSFEILQILKHLKFSFSKCRRCWRRLPI